MLRFHLQHCAHSHHNTLHRLLISSTDFIVLASSDNLFKAKPFSIPPIPISPFSLQTLELFHSRRVLSSNNSSKPTSNLGPFSLRNSGFSYAARPKAPPAVSLERSTPLSSRLSVLTKRLTKLGFKDCEYMPGQYNHLLCPMCKGGHSGGKSLSLNISKDGNSAAWICFRGTCGWQGNTMAFVNAVSSNGKLNQTMKAQSSYGKLNQTVKAKKRELIEKNLELEPLSDKANPTHEKYLNKKIDLYDEVAVVVGKDVAQGSGAKSFDDVEMHVNLEEKGDGDDECVKENDKQSTSSAPLESRKSRKRTRDDDLELQNISNQMGEVALALQKISKSKLDVDILYQEVMKTEGFEEEFLGTAFDHLLERENLAKGFLAKSEKLRRIWLQKFKENS